MRRTEGDHGDPLSASAAPELSHAPPKLGALKPAVLIGSSLDALFRITRTWVNEQTQRKVATRTAEVWRTTDPNLLELRATSATVDDDLALQANETDGRWLLPAFMAGMRSVKPRMDVSAEDFICLVSELMGLTPSAESIEHFHDWLCADGAEGFEVQVDRSFSEVLEEALHEDERHAQRLLAVRHQPVAPFDGVAIASRDIDAAALRKEFEIPLGLHASKQLSHHFQMSEEEVADLSARCDDPNDWTLVEMEAVLALPALRSMVSPSRLARRIVGRIMASPDARLLGLLAELQQGDDPFRKAIAAALKTPEVGATIGREIGVRDPKALAALGGYLNSGASSAVSASMLSLLTRAITDEAAFDALRWLADAYGVPRLRAWIDPSMLQEAAAGTLGRVLSQCQAPPGVVSEILAALAPAPAVALLKQIDMADLTPLSPVIKTHLDRATQHIAQALADIVLERPYSGGLEILGTLLSGGKCNGWSGRRLYALCGALVRAGRGEKYLLHLARSNATPVALRLIVLDTLSTNPQLLAQACARQMSDLLAPPEVQRRLKELRGGLKRERS